MFVTLHPLRTSIFGKPTLSLYIAWHSNTPRNVKRRVGGRGMYSLFEIKLPQTILLALLGTVERSAHLLLLPPLHDFETKKYLSVNLRRIWVGFLLFLQFAAPLVRTLIEKMSRVFFRLFCCLLCTWAINNRKDCTPNEARVRKRRTTYIFLHVNYS